MNFIPDKQYIMDYKHAYLMEIYQEFLPYFEACNNIEDRNGTGGAELYDTFRCNVTALINTKNGPLPTSINEILNRFRNSNVWRNNSECYDQQQFTILYDKWNKAYREYKR